MLWSPTTDLFGSSSQYWMSTLSFPDIATNIAYDSNIYSNYFVTPVISSYTYLPRSFGIASAVGNPVGFQTEGMFSGDIDNSYVAIPFYYKNNTDSTFYSSMQPSHLAIPVAHC
jgi:hypothetical protein